MLNRLSSPLLAADLQAPGVALTAGDAAYSGSGASPRKDPRPPSKCLPDRRSRLIGQHGRGQGDQAEDLTAVIANSIAHAAKAGPTLGHKRSPSQKL